MWTAAGIFSFATYGLTRLATNPNYAWRVGRFLSEGISPTCSHLGMVSDSMFVCIDDHTCDSIMAFIFQIEKRKKRTDFNRGKCRRRGNGKTSVID